MDGKGRLFLAQLISLQPAQVKILEKIKEKPLPAYRIQIAFSWTKRSERTEWFIEKAVEMGLNDFFPIICERSERTNFSEERVQRIIHAAAQQSLNLHLPIFHPLQEFSEILKLKTPNRFIAHCLPEERKKITQVAQVKEDILCLIGPEGDFSKTEIEAAKNSGFTPIVLGDFRLRSETAALFSLFEMIHFRGE